jgi:hypothetical protein
MVRSLATSMLILAGTLVLCLLALRLVVSALIALSGILWRGTCGQALSW